MEQSEISQLRKVSWLELFFDLVFVVAVSASTAILYKDLSLSGVFYFIFLFLPIWWTWISFSYFTDQFEEDTLLQRIALFPVMFGVLILANSMPDAVDANIFSFVITYVALRVLLIILYSISWIQYSECRSLTSRYIVGFTIGAAIWLISLFVPRHLGFTYRSIALLIEIMTPVISYLTAKNVPAQVSHMDERFGLFTLIVLGETIVAVALGIKGIHWHLFESLNSISGFCCAIAMWKLYFTNSDEQVINKALRGDRWKLFWSFVYGYSHFLIFISIPAFGVAINEVIKNAANISSALWIILVGSPLTYLAGLTIIQYASCNMCGKTLIGRILAIFAICILAFFAPLTLLPFAILYLAVVLLALAIVESLFLNCNRSCG